SIVEGLPFLGKYHALCLKVTLLANRFTQRGLQTARIDDGVVQPAHDLVLLAPTHVQLTRAVAALAADGVGSEDRHLKAIGAVLDRGRVVAVAEQTSPTDLPLKPARDRVSR